MEKLPLQSTASNDTPTRLWMSDHNLLNESKTEAIIISAPNRKRLQYVSCVSVCECSIVPSPTIRNLGIMI